MPETTDAKSVRAMQVIPHAVSRNTYLINDFPGGGNNWTGVVACPTGAYCKNDGK